MLIASPLREKSVEKALSFRHAFYPFACKEIPLRALFSYIIMQRGRNACIASESRIRMHLNIGVIGVRNVKLYPGFETRSPVVFTSDLYIDG